jgi:hypothetical protein
MSSQYSSSLLSVHVSIIESTLSQTYPTSFHTYFSYISIYNSVSYSLFPTNFAYGQSTLFYGLRSCYLYAISGSIADSLKFDFDYRPDNSFFVSLTNNFTPFFYYYFYLNCIACPDLSPIQIYNSTSMRI